MNADADADGKPLSSYPSSVLAQVRDDWTQMKPHSPIYQILLDDISIVDASAGHITALLQVAPVHLNSKGTLHGSVSVCLTDWAGGLAIKSTGQPNTGLSTDIHTTFVSTARIGDTLVVEGRASKVGRCLAFTTVEIRKSVDGEERGPVVCTGTHTKYIKQ
ncbi:hypothetical protein MMC22_006472 [Lobaria immixta]|nr:hypothetical protein [Lobaria immixta]